MEIYQPAEDSYFFADFLKNYLSKSKNKEISYLDMGTGSGILAETAIISGIKKQNILTADINPKAVEFVKNKLKIKTIKSGLFDNIPKSKKFDIITFNPPYLPQHKYDKKPDTTGGIKGDEIPLKFLKQARQYLTKNGKIFLLISNYTPQEKIAKFNPKIIAEKKLFFEELYILEVK